MLSVRGIDSRKGGNDYLLRLGVETGCVALTGTTEPEGVRSPAVPRTVEGNLLP